IEKNGKSNTRRIRRKFKFFFFSSRRRHTRSKRDWSSDVCSSDLLSEAGEVVGAHRCAAEFHAIVTELSGNELLAEIGALLDSRMRWQLSQHDDLDVVAAERAELVEAIARRDQAQGGALAARRRRTTQDRHEKHSRRLARLAEDVARGEGD